MDEASFSVMRMAYAQQSVRSWLWILMALSTLEDSLPLAAGSAPAATWQELRPEPVSRVRNTVISWCLEIVAQASAQVMLLVGSALVLGSGPKARLLCVQTA